MARREPASPPAPLAAEVCGAVRRFGGSDDVVVALDGVDLAVGAATVVVVAGPSGSGKSTLLSLLACLQRPDEGSVTIGATDVLAIGRRQRRRVRRDRLGIVLPQPSENLLDRLDVLGNLRWAAARRARHPSAPDDRRDPSALLDLVGLAGAGRRRVRELSGGEQQRLAVACALAGGPDLLVLDEPTASLDRAGATALVEVLSRLAGLGRLAGLAGLGPAMVIATHDPMVIDAADTVVGLDHGRRTR